MNACSSFIHSSQKLETTHEHKLMNIHILGYYSVIKRNKLLIYAMICVDLNNIVQSERAGTKYNIEFYENLEMANLMYSDGKHIRARGGVNRPGSGTKELSRMMELYVIMVMCTFVKLITLFTLNGCIFKI